MLSFNGVSVCSAIKASMVSLFKNVKIIISEGVVHKKKAEQKESREIRPKIKSQPKDY